MPTLIGVPGTEWQRHPQGVRWRVWGRGQCPCKGPEEATVAWEV
jgi:hypothetical protein